ncbi:MAG: hypothetical protein KF749_13250 [Bacteroidetes bacterium]|nr:hypothetical protein [Bacteroidota bacterium]MCW5894339.1 hypothetical protein [Bacteroidota bacterium]
MKTIVLTIAVATLFVAIDGYGQRKIGNTRDPATTETGSRNPGGRPAETRPAEQPATPPPPPETPRPPVHPHPIVPPPPVLIGGTVCILPVQPAPVVVINRADTRQEPEANEVILHDKESFPNKSGFDFSSEDVVSFADEGADVYFSISDEGSEFIVRDDSDIQDLGQRDDFPERHAISPTAWSSARRVSAEPENVYVVWTWDNQYYSFRVIAISESRVSFDWQKVAGGARIPSDLSYRNGETRRNTLIAKFGK